jgi:outer membrane protein assembly factor BamB
MIAILLVVAGTLGTGGYMLYSFLQKSEEELLSQAMQDYRDLKFSSASTQFNYLAEQFRSSDQLGTYRFLAKLSSVRARMYDTEADAVAVIPLLDEFLRDFKEDQQLNLRAHDIGVSVVTMAENFAKRHTNPTSLDPLAGAVKLEEARTTVRRLVGAEAFAGNDEGKFDTALQGVRSAVDHWDRHNKVIEGLKKLKPTSDGIRMARQLIKDKTAEFANLAADPDVVALLQKMEESHLAGVVYEKAAGGEPVAVTPQSGPPSIVFELLLEGTPAAPPPDDPVKLALVRGVLYALRQTDGTIKWARRVGIDTTTLPVHVPATPTASDRFLVLSSDSLTLTALDADGRPVWQYPLSKPCLGRPVVVDHRAFLPTFDGVVHEIELARGTLLGRYHLGQPLTVGGVREPDSKRLYLPADDSCVYVLDVQAQRCEKILYTDHPAGSLRSEPLIIPPVDLPGGGAAPGFFVLNQADGLESVRLRVYELPLASPHQEPRLLDPESRLEGWTWFRPHQDQEKIVTVSDQGRLGIFGIRQANNKDQPLFPLLSAGGIHLTPFLGLSPASKDAPTPGARALRGRSQVVHAQGDDLWVLAEGQLQRIDLGWDSQHGRRAMTGWDRPLALGSPLHESQITEEVRRGRSTLFLVTQPLDQQVCMATAVEDEDGKVQWQRQIGLVCHGEPVSLTPPDDRAGGPLLLLLDQGGGLFALDPGRFPAGAKAAWQTGGQNVARALTDNPLVPPVLVAAPDGHVAYELACPGDGKNLLVRQVEWEPAGRRLKVAERLVPVPSPLAGTPAVVGTSLVFPLAGGNLGRILLPLPRDVKVDEGGPDWRDYLASREIRGHVLALAGDLFVATNGGRGLNCFEWPRDAAWNLKNPGGAKVGLELNDRIVGVPVILPVAAGNLPRIAAADAGGVVTLIGVRGDGTMEVKRTWDLKGKVPSGVFVRTLPGGQARLSCVVDRERLVWLDPGRDDPEWEYSAPAAIIGQPQMAGRDLIVVDQSGLVGALDVATGKPQGSGYTLPGSVAPTAGVAPFGAKRALLPLSDGTALLLDLER